MLNVIVDSTVKSPSERQLVVRNHEDVTVPRKLEPSDEVISFSEMSKDDGSPSDDQDRECRTPEQIHEPDDIPSPGDEYPEAPLASSTKDSKGSRRRKGSEW